MSKGKFALGAIIGAAAGVVAGVLSAPKSGKETRADLKEKAVELKKDTAHRSDEMKSRVDSAVHEAKDKTQEYKERGGRAVTGAVDGAKKGFYDKK